MKISKLLLLSCFMLTVCAASAQSQSIDIEDYNLDVKEVVQKGSIGTISAEKGNKYIGIELIITALTKENETFNLADLEIKSSNGEVQSSFKKGPSRYSTISIKKPKLRRFFAEVDESFTSGDIYYNGQLVGSIELTEGTKKGQFAVAK